MHVTRITKPGATHPIEPQSVVLLDPATGEPYAASGGSSNGVLDSAGQAFSPEACAHTYAYAGGLLTTDTAIDGTATWVKTYSYTAGVLTGETKWVRQ